MRVCPSCGAENPDEARFCMACASPLAEPARSREVRKSVTVVFCDVTGSTALGELLDPETLRRVMARYFDTMKIAIEHHGGTVEKFIGDAVMAVFGIPQCTRTTPCARCGPRWRCERGCSTSTRSSSAIAASRSPRGSA